MSEEMKLFVVETTVEAVVAAKDEIEARHVAEMFGSEILGEAYGLTWDARPVPVKDNAVQHLPCDWIGGIPFGNEEWVNDRECHDIVRDLYEEQLEAERLARIEAEQIKLDF